MRSFKIAAEVTALRALQGDGLSGMYHEAFQSTKILENLGAQRAALLTELAKQVGVLKEKHPRQIELRNELGRVEAQIRDAIQGTLQSFTQVLGSLSEEENKLSAEKARLEKDMADSRRHLTEYKRLDADLVTAKDLYNTYLKKLSEVRATSGTVNPGVRVVDPATVPREAYKKPQWIVGLGFVLGLLLASASVGAAEMRNDRLRSPREVEVFLGLDVLGEIPEEPGARQGRGHPLLLPEDDPDSPAWEAYRGLRAHLVTRLEEIPRGKIIFVSSPEEGEGKSTVAANLARTLAMDDQRVLLFDAELRWPLMKGLLADSMDTGLEELLRGELTLREAVQPSRIPGVDVLGADTGLLWASEMAGSSRFQAALKSARDLYDYIVIDSAPVNLVSETALIARRADAVLLVVRQGRTGRSSARLSRRKLEAMRVPLLGSVVIGTTVPPNHYEYRNRRDLAKEARILETEGDNLVGVV
jgi:capsular exopolysaccharide synthesis family protein